MNKEAENLLQRNREDLLERVIWEEFKEAAGTTFDREYHRALMENKTVTFEEFYAPLDGWFEVHAYPSEEGLTVYFRDITERKESEQARQEAMPAFANRPPFSTRQLMRLLCAASTIISSFGTRARSGSTDGLAKRWSANR